MENRSADNAKTILCASSPLAPKVLRIIPELGKVRLDQFAVETQQMFITRMPERATEKIVSGRDNPKCPWNPFNSPNNGPRLGLQL